MKISSEYIRFELNVKGILQKKTECWVNIFIIWFTCMYIVECGKTVLLDE